MVKVLKILIIISLIACGFLAGLYVGFEFVNSTSSISISNINIGEVLKLDETNLNIESEVQQPKNESVSLTISFGNDKIVNTSVALANSKETVWDILQKAAQDNNLVIRSKEYSGLGIFIEAIGDQKNSGDKYWQYWLNGEYAKVGASSQEVKSGDVVEWKFIKGQL